MEAKLSPELKEFRLNQLRKRILKPRGKQIHASDLDLCPLKTFYRRCHPDPPEIPEINLLFFMSGICAEAWLAPELIEPKEKDGIVGSPDDQCLHGYSEIKATRANMTWFDPMKSNRHWIFRIKTYCNIFEVLKWGLEVFFWSGKYKSDKPIAYEAWQLTFSGAELEKHWVEALKRRDVLQRAFETNSAPPIEKVWLSSWECKFCEFSGNICEYRQKEVSHE